MPASTPPSIRRPRRTGLPLTVAAATVTLAVLAAAAPASATTGSGAGRSRSAISLLRLTAAGHTVSVLGTSLSTTTLSDPTKATITVVPVRVDGTAIGAQHITQDTSGQPTVGARTGSVAGIVSLTSPSVVLKATRTATGPLATITGSGVGSLSLLGSRLPAVSGALRIGSDVRAGTAHAGKSVVIDGLTLPSIGALLAKLGLDVSLLPIDVLRQLVDKLSLTTSAFDSAASALDSALSAAGSTIDGIDLSTADAATSAIADQTTLVADKRTAVNDALAAAPFSNAVIVTLLGTLGISAPSTAAAWDALSTSQQNQLVSALDGISAGSGTAIATADAALAGARQLLATLKDIKGLLNTLLDTIEGILGTTPLLSIGRLDVGTVADAGGTHRARIVGSLSGLHVLGTDVLKTALGSSSLDIAGLGATTLETVQATIAGVTGTLASTLSSVSGLTVHAPKVTVLARHTSTAPINGFEAAKALVTGLSLSWRGLTLPKALALPNAASLPGVSSLNATSLVTKPIGMSVARLTDASRFAAAATPGANPVSAPPASNPPSSTPTTGLPAGIALTALALLVGAGAVRRLRLATD